VYVTNSPLLKIDIYGLSSSYSCRCIATGGGVSDRPGSKKCSYRCTCNIFSCDGEIIKTINVNVDNVKTTAYSQQAWDRGSPICHGQYGYRPSPSSPNWDIETKFSVFNINQDGGVSYDPGPVEVDRNRHQDNFPRSPTANEVSDAINDHLN
jgi:hypothetical protein